jgi:hypothetical protein
MTGGSIIFQTTINTVVEFLIFLCIKISLNRKDPYIVQICSHGPKLVKYGIKVPLVEIIFYENQDGSCFL